jgi:hypothetical protein
MTNLNGASREEVVDRGGEVSQLVLVGHHRPGEVKSVSL